MIQDRAHITTIVHALPLGRYEYSFEWEGSPRLPVLVDHDTLRRLGLTRFPREIKTLPWPLRLIPGSEDDIDCFVRNAALYVRTDGANRLAWAYWNLRELARRIARPAYVRLILTLMVWGLAHVPQGERVSWRHVGRKRA